MPTMPVGYTMFLDSMASGLVDLHSDTFKAMLLEDYTVGTTVDEAQFLADVLAVATEAAGTGYTAGGQVLGSVSFDRTGSAWFFTADDVTWDPSTVDAAFLVVYDGTPATDATRPVVCFLDFGGIRSSAASAFTVQWNASGLFSFTNISS